MTPTPRIPVIMYHSVGRRLDDWLWADLRIPETQFEKQIELLKSRRYTPLSLDALHEAQARGDVGRERRVVLTFDDGYLDNWVFAYPILKRHDWRGTVYVNPEFIDPGETPRPNLEDVWAGRCSAEDLQVHGFLNRAELRILHQSGVLEVGSHSMSHTWYPVSPRIVDFHRPGLDTPWLGWNARPERKFAYLTEDQTGFTPFGQPIHEHGRSLGVRRYLPDPEEAAAAIAEVENGEPDFFDRPDWRKHLDAAAAPFAESGRLETDEEMDTRYTAEILDAKSALEEILDAPVNHFCWPGGAYNDRSWAAIESAGHRTICITRRDTTRWNSEDPRFVRRAGCGNEITFMGKRYATEDPNFLLLACEIESGYRRWKPVLSLRKLGLALASGFKGL